MILFCQLSFNQDPNAAPITTTTVATVRKSFTKFDGWCADSKGDYQWSYYTVKGDFSSGEDCANAAMQMKKAKGATFSTSTGQCFYLMDEVAKGGSDYPGYQCFVFKVFSVSSLPFFITVLLSTFL